MRNNNDKPCKFCSGQGVTTSDAGIIQRCPMCDGSGADYSKADLYEYAINLYGANALGANGTASPTVQITTFDFEWQYMMAEATGPFLIQVVDAGTKLQFSNDLVHQNCFCGTAQNPMPLLRTHRFAKTGGIQVNLQDLSGADNSIFLGFLGVQIP